MAYTRNGSCARPRGLVRALRDTIVNGPDLWPVGARVIRYIESRPEWPIVDLSYDQFSDRWRHAVGISVRFSDPLTDIEMCYLCCR